ncbi:1319_t:CDS:2, partial [Cetraspora pellucida]
SFAGTIPSDHRSQVPTSIGNYVFPTDVTIPANLTVPKGNCFKFSLHVSGYIWYQCEGRVLFFNHEEDASQYPDSAVASTYNPGSSVFGSAGIRSIIPKYDSSSLIATTTINYQPPDPKDFPWGLEETHDNTGDGAFKDITYILRLNTKNGIPPPNSLCGTQYEEGYIYSSIISAQNLFYHPGPDK